MNMVENVRWYSGRTRSARVASAVACLVAFLALPLFGAEEVWRTDRVIDAPIEIRGKGLRILPGVQVTFAGSGSLNLLDGSLRCERVVFAADSVLTNRFRIAASKSRAEFRDCTFRNVRSVNPAGKHFIDGGVLVNGAGSRIEHCTFVGCSPVMLTNAHRSEIERNLVIGGDMGFSLLQCRDCRLAGNEFYEVSDIGIKLSNVKNSEVCQNRFTACRTGVRLYHCTDDRLVGNAFFDGGAGILIQGGRSGISLQGNRFEGVKTDVREAK